MNVKSVLFLLLIVSGISVGAGYYLGNLNDQDLDETNLSEVNKTVISPAEEDSNVTEEEGDESDSSPNSIPNEANSYTSEARIDEITDSIIVRLKESNFFEADLETERFFFEVLGKDFINSYDIRNFDCDQLNKVNSIWLNHTGDKLGFSRFENVFKNLYLQILYDNKMPADTKDKELISRAIVYNYGSLFNYVGVATGAELDLTIGNFKNRKSPIFISAVFPNVTDQGIERFQLLNSRLESCNLIEMDSKAIRKNIVDNDDRENYSLFLEEVNAFKERARELDCSSALDGTTIALDCTTILRSAMPVPHPWFEEFYEIDIEYSN